jgi:hypothetical protein
VTGAFEQRGERLAVGAIVVRDENGSHGKWTIFPQRSAPP